MASRFWVGGTGTWDAADTTHWAASSGGAGGETVPTSSDDVTFDSNSGTAATVTTSGAARPANTITINKSDLTLTFGDTVAVTGALTLTTGTLNTAGFAWSASSFSSSNSNTRTLTLGSSAITLSLSGVAWNAATVTNLTVSANTATVTCTGSNVTFNGGGKNWNGLSVVGTGSGVIQFTSGGTFLNVTRTGNAVKTDSISTFTAGFTVTGVLTLTGNSSVNRLLLYTLAPNGGPVGTVNTITCSNPPVLTDVDIRDVTAAGAGGTWSGTRVKNALGNTNITFDAPLTCTHVAGAAGNVSTAANWDTGTVPTCQDTIVVPATTTGTLTNDMPRLGPVSFAAGFTGTFTNSATLEVYGSWANASGMTLAGTSNLSFLGRSSHTITSAGKTWASAITVNAPGGTYTLADALTDSRAAAGAITCTLGTFNDGGFSITLTGSTAGFITNGATVTLSGTTTIASTTAATPWSCTSGTVNHTGVIVLSAATATDRTFAGGGKTYGTLTDSNTSTGKLTITGANTFGTINKTAAAACTLALPTSSGITVTGQFNVNGILGALLTLTGDVTKVSGIVQCQYLSISSSDASGGATFYAGRTSTDGGSNSGWQFVDYITGTLTGSGTGSATATGIRSTFGTAAASGLGAGAGTGTRSVLGAAAGSGTGSGTVTGHSVGPTPATSTPEATTQATSTPEAA